MRARVVGLGLLAVFASVPVLAVAGTPGEAFLAFYEAVLKAKSVDEIVPMVPKVDRDKLKAVPAHAREMFLEMHRGWARLSGERPKVLKETVEGDTATLEAETVCVYTETLKPRCQATVALVKESDGWKVLDRPKWKRQ